MQVNPTIFAAVKKWTFLFLIAFLAFSCEDDNTCGITEQSDELFVEFFNYQTGELLAVDFDSVGVMFGNAGVFYLADTTAAILPLDVSGLVTDFTFHTDSADFDFRFSYRTEIIIENEKCDPVFRIFALDASFIEMDSLSIDSVSIRVFELTKLASPHVEIYF